MSPSCTHWPDSKWILATVPGRSALIVTPWIAATVPITSSVDGHVSFCAVIVVTAVGGGWKLAPCAIAVWIWRNFTNPKLPRRTTTTTSMNNIRFSMIKPIRKTNESPQKRFELPTKLYKLRFRTGLQDSGEDGTQKNVTNCLSFGVA